jgi:hypothetical protein
VIRVALAVLLATALLGAAMPAVDDARIAATDRALGADLSRLGTAVETLAARHDAVRPEVGPARRTVRLVVPEGSWGRGRAIVTISTGPGGGRLAWQVGGDPPRTLRVDVELRVWRDGEVVAGELRLGPGDHRLVLSLVRVDGRPTVAVRGFKSDTGGNSPRVRVGSGRDESVRV